MPERSWKDETCGTCAFACEKEEPGGGPSRLLCRRLPPQMVHVRQLASGYVCPDICGYPFVWSDLPACAEWKEAPDG